MYDAVVTILAKDNIICDEHKQIGLDVLVTFTEFLKHILDYIDADKAEMAEKRSNKHTPKRKKRKTECSRQQQEMIGIVQAYTPLKNTIDISVNPVVNNFTNEVIQVNGLLRL